METHQQFGYLQEKINAIGTALFLNYSEAVVKLPSSVITEARVDDYGYIWFYAPKKNEELQVFDNAFPLRLEFFKKGVEYFVQVEGKGWIVTDPEETDWYSTWSDNPLPNACYVLVKVKIIDALLHQQKNPAPAGVWQQTWNFIFWPVNQALHLFRPGF